MQGMLPMHKPSFVRYEGGFDFAAALHDASKNAAYWQEGLLIEVARRITTRQARENLSVLEQTQRLLHTNVQEALALEVSLLKLQL